MSEALPTSIYFPLFGVLALSSSIFDALACSISYSMFEALAVNLSFSSLQVG
jgi:hypothetical protein